MRKFHKSPIAGLITRIFFYGLFFVGPCALTESHALHVRMKHYFLTGKGKPTEPRTYRQFFARFLKKHGLAKMRFHEVRHTFAVRAMEIPEFDIKSLSEILGHKNVPFTLNVYGRANLQQKTRCMNLLNDLL